MPPFQGGDASPILVSRSKNDRSHHNVIRKLHKVTFNIQQRYIMIIFINGSINSGKSTVSKILAEKLGNTAILEIDHLRHFIHWMSLDESIPITLEGACSLIKNFNKYGLNVIIPYPLSQKNYEFIVKLLKGLNSVNFITLNPALDEVLKNRGTRELTDKETDRIKYHYEIGINNPKFGIVIDNTKQTPKETANEILKVINNA